MNTKRSPLAAAALFGSMAVLSACAPGTVGPGPELSPVTAPTKPAPVSALPDTKGFAGGPGVGAGLNSGIGPGPSFNNRFAR